MWPPATPSRFEPFGQTSQPYASGSGKPESRRSPRVILHTVASFHRSRPHCYWTRLTSATPSAAAWLYHVLPRLPPWESSRSPPISHARLPAIPTLITPTTPVCTRPVSSHLLRGCALLHHNFHTGIGLLRFMGGSPIVDATSGSPSLRAGCSPAGLRTHRRRMSPTQVSLPALSSASGPNRSKRPWRGLQPL